MAGRNQLVTGGLAARGTPDQQLKMRDLQEGVAKGERKQKKKKKKVCVCPKEKENKNVSRKTKIER